MSRWHSYGVGQYRASEGHSFIGNRLYKPDGTKRAVLNCVEHGQTALHQITTGWDHHILARLADAGYPVLSGDLGGNAWGNATGQTALGQLRTYAGSPFGAKIDKVFIVATSMGAALACNWAKANPTLVQAIALFIPAVDMQDIHANNRGGLASSIATAWGGAAPPDASNPADYAADLSSIPIKVWGSSSDTTCTPAVVAAFVAASGAEFSDLGAVGHSPVTVSADSVLSFFEENL